ncbi:MAG: hypothetical protein HYT49_02395 [Candidatus Wildermuthbacteria bacterium]|nr:hypothetical protein [Candidatus Wildermuthbacteria bacterium]
MKRLKWSVIAIGLAIAFAVGLPGTAYADGIPAVACNDSNLAIPLFSDSGIREVRIRLSQYVCPGDAFILVSGNQDGEADTDWLNKNAQTLALEFPYVRILAATSGLMNVEKVSREANELIDTVVYVYEPNFPNVPEFTWEFEPTLFWARIGARIAHSYRKEFWFKPTGRPLLQPPLQQYGWDYGALATLVDGLIVQTQGYCKNEAYLVLYREAMQKLRQQYVDAGAESVVFPQVTVGKFLRNAVDADRAAECAGIAQDEAYGYSGIMLWWEIANTEEMAAFLEKMRPSITIEDYQG